MKFKKTLIIGLLFVAAVAAVLRIGGTLNASAADGRPLKEACLKAVICVIGMEIKN